MTSLAAGAAAAGRAMLLNKMAAAEINMMRIGLSFYSRCYSRAALPPW